MSDSRHVLEEEQLLSDASALERLADMDEWKVFDRLMADYADRILLALRQRGLGLVETESLRAELDTVDWMRYRPIALRRAVQERDTMRLATLKASQDGESRR